MWHSKVTSFVLFVPSIFTLGGPWIYRVGEFLHYSSSLPRIANIRPLHLDIWKLEVKPILKCYM